MIVHVYIPDHYTFFCKHCCKSDEYQEIKFKNGYDWASLPSDFYEFRAVDIRKKELVVQDTGFLRFYKKCLHYIKNNLLCEMRYDATEIEKERIPVSEADDWPYKHDGLLYVLSDFAEKCAIVLNGNGPPSRRLVPNLIPNLKWFKKQHEKLREKKRKIEIRIEGLQFMLSEQLKPERTKDQVKKSGACDMT